MRRSLFWKLFLRLALAAGVVMAGLELLPRVPWWALAVLVVGCAGLMSWWTANSLRLILQPLERSADLLVEGKQAALETTYRDFDGLASALASASEQVHASLGKAAESRRELEALLDSMQDAVVAVDGAGRIQWTNQRMRRLMPGGVNAAAGSLRAGQSLVQTIRDPRGARMRWGSAGKRDGECAAVDVADPRIDLRGECFADTGWRGGGGVARCDSD